MAPRSQGKIVGVSAGGNRKRYLHIDLRLAVILTLIEMLLVQIGYEIMPRNSRNRSYFRRKWTWKRGFQRYVIGKGKRKNGKSLDLELLKG